MDEDKTEQGLTDAEKRAEARWSTMKDEARKKEMNRRESIWKAELLWAMIVAFSESDMVDDKDMFFLDMADSAKSKRMTLEMPSAIAYVIADLVHYAGKSEWIKDGQAFFDTMNRFIGARLSEIE